MDIRWLRQAPRHDLCRAIAEFYSIVRRANASLSLAELTEKQRWYISMISIIERRCDHDLDRQKPQNFGQALRRKAFDGQAVHAWPQPGCAPAQGIPFRGHRGESQQGRRQG